MKTLLLVALATLVLPAGAFAKPRPKSAAQKLYELASLLQGGDGDCGEGSCFATLTNVDCTWSVIPGYTNDNCSFNDLDGTEQRIHGAKAAKLADLIYQVGKVESDAGGSTGGFIANQNISCAEKRKVGARKPVFTYECKVAPNELSDVQE